MGIWLCESKCSPYIFTSNNNGMHTLVCSNDETHTLTEECVFSEWQVVKEAKPFEEGKEERVCIKCNYKEERVIPLTHKHEYSDEWTIDKEATCTEKGFKSHHCIKDNCTSIVDVTEIEMLDHD